jgi:hypothetical protein
MRFELYSEEIDNRAAYITGNFNSWNPKDDRYRLTQLDPNKYFIEIDDQILPDVIEFKFTKGGWETLHPTEKLLNPKEKRPVLLKNGDSTGALSKMNTSRLLRLFQKNFTFPSLNVTEKFGHFCLMTIIFPIKAIPFCISRMHKICSTKAAATGTGKLIKSFPFWRNMAGVT